MTTPADNAALRLVEATANDLDRIMELERQGFAAGHQELRSAYAQRIATFPQGSLMAWRGVDCVGCVFSEIWQATPQSDAAHFTLGHDIRERHDPVLGTELYISSMTLAPSVRGLGLGTPLLTGCLENVARQFPGVTSALLLVNANWVTARRIYAGAGFVEIARLDRFFSTRGAEPQDGIVMRRKMRP
jgi:ribosomal protein S18 acetylase RimI-like enzyme